MGYFDKRGLNLLVHGVTHIGHQRPSFLLLNLLDQTFVVFIESILKDLLGYYRPLAPAKQHHL